MVKEFSSYCRLVINCFAAILLVSLATGCSDDLPGNKISGDSITVSGSILIPDMERSVTRGIIGETPKNGLKLTVFEFDLGADDAHSFLSNIYTADLKSPTGVANNGIVTFNLTLKSASTPKVLHLMVADKPLTSQFGSVATILPALTVGGNQETEAYWGCVKFENGFTTTDDDGNPVILDDLRQKLTQVPVIRNFAKVTVEIDNSVKNFSLIGFDLINVPTAGTVGPWDQNAVATPDLLNGSTMKDYSAFTYKGFTPASAYFRNTEVSAKNWTESSSNMRDTGAKYIYEHPYESTRRTYLIVHGLFYKDGTPTRSFYKIDLGKPGENSIFEYYNIIRNIHYNVKITNVEMAGAATVNEAITRAPFNNLSAATETSSMLNISDNTNLLIVNDTNHIIIDENQTINVLYRYIADINVAGGSSERNDIPYPVGLQTGPVIKSFTDTPVAVTQNGENWMKISITPNRPTSIAKTQSFSIVDGNGLGRTITLVLRSPWEYEPIVAPNGQEYIATVAPGDNNLYDPSDPAPKPISKKSGEPLTVYFNLPNGLDQNMFPLTFQIESKHQWIENNKVGNLVVNYGPSLFDTSVTAISYIKTVSYEEYLYNYFNDGSNDLNINSSNVNHTVRCRFLTIAEAAGDAEIKIHCDYFKPDASVTFTRQ